MVNKGGHGCHCFAEKNISQIIDKRFFDHLWGSSLRNKHPHDEMMSFSIPSPDDSLFYLKNIVASHAAVSSWSYGAQDSDEDEGEDEEEDDDDDDDDDDDFDDEDDDDFEEEEEEEDSFENLKSESD